eukprot:TRINITY_DN66882_c0_g1_i1.p1 TRINITY_DN66882_c0_g1~~TRINITY_DN66882_c0_g1_i1.p1  ORF type:complete len:238 (-),score=3.11 TRINITY_DN66882_c0_g1_i1:585-1298(-)
MLIDHHIPPWAESVLTCVLGLTGMLLVVGIPCSNGHYICKNKIPTLSYAAQFQPGKYWWSTLMSVVALLQARSNAYCVRLAQLTSGPRAIHGVQVAWGNFIVSPCLFISSIAAMDDFELIHVVTSAIFFAGLWIEIIMIIRSMPSFLISPTIRLIVRILFICGSIGGFSFLYLFFAVNRYISNPLGFSETAETLAELASGGFPLLFWAAMGFGPLRALRMETKSFADVKPDRQKSTF